VQNRYSGDVGDFGKFGLLRHLLNDKDYSLGINWYLFPNEGHNEDGRYINYLTNINFRQCDNELHKKLQRIVSTTRSVNALEKSNLFNCKTTYFSKLVDFYLNHPGQTKTQKENRLLLRIRWQEEAISTLSNTNVLFIDPDNGLQINSCKSLNQKKSGKFSYFDEISKFHQGKDFTVIYHHLNRHKKHGTHVQQILSRTQELKENINSKHTVFCIRYIPYSPRAFFIVAHPKSVGYIKHSLNQFLKSSWGQHWDNYYEL